MRTLVTDGTANQLLDYLASDGDGERWTYFADLGEWGLFYNLLGEARFVSRLARNLADRRLAERRRTGRGMQLRLTPAGITLAGERARCADDAAGELDWSAVVVVE
jgi:hypothetical protein